MKTTINKVMLYGVLAMILTWGVASADRRWTDRGEFDHRMEDGADRWERWEKGEKANKMKWHSEDYAAHQQALETAVINNNFTAYNAQIEAAKAEKEAVKKEYCNSEDGADSKKCNNDSDNHDELTKTKMTEKIQEHFDKARANYLETGEVKIKKSYKKRGPGKYFKASHAGMVKKIIKTVDADRLERALAKINDRIESIEDETVLDLLEGIRETIQAVIDAQE